MCDKSEWIKGDVNIPYKFFTLFGYNPYSINDVSVVISINFIIQINKIIPPEYINAEIAFFFSYESDIFLSKSSMVFCFQQYN